MPNHPPPNIVIVHWHDLGTFLGCYGHSDVDSPNLDRLASQGTLFSNAFATAPLCTPARGALFTGRYPHSNGLMGLAHRGWEYFDGETTLPMLLRGAGYRSTLIGLQHETSNPHQRLGYDEIIRATDDPEGNEYCGPVSRAAVEWLNDRPHDDKPFLLVVGFFETHRPYPPGRYDEPDTTSIDVPAYLPDMPAVREDLAGFYGSIRAADRATGDILNAIDQRGLDQDTLVIFTTDHGEAFPRAKSTLYDPGIHVALMMRPPTRWGVTPATHHGLVSHVDVVPSLLELCNVNIPSTVQGTSFGHLFDDSLERTERTTIFAEKTYHGEYDPIRAIRTERYKYLRNFEARPALQLPLDIENSSSRTAIGDDHLSPRPVEELYDLTADPYETTNLAYVPEWRTTRDELSASLATWQRDTSDPILDGPIPVPAPSHVHS